MLVKHFLIFNKKYKHLKWSRWNNLKCQVRSQYKQSNKLSDNSQ